MVQLPLILKANSTFSMATGVLMLILNPWVGELTGVPSAWLATVGAGLLVFALVVRRIAHDPPNRNDVIAVIAADLLWVVGAVILIVGFPDALTTPGKWVLGVASVIVLDFTALQLIGLARLGRT